MQFSPEVERWRTTVAKYVPIQFLEKALWTMQYESGGNPEARGDSGAAIGLYQIHSNESIPGRPSPGALLDPEYNIRYAAQNLGMSSGNFSAWGDGTANLPPYNPATGTGRFGALGNYPFPGDTNPAINGRAPLADNVGGVITAGFPIDIPTDIPFIDIPGIGRATQVFTGPAGAIFSVGGKLFDKLGNPIGTITDGIDAVKSAASKSIEIFLWLLNPHNWFRLFFIALGSALFALGAYVYIRGDSVASDASTAAKAVA